MLSDMNYVFYKEKRFLKIQIQNSYNIELTST